MTYHSMMQLSYEVSPQQEQQQQRFVQHHDAAVFERAFIYLRICSSPGRNAAAVLFMSIFSFLLYTYVVHTCTELQVLFGEGS